MTDLARLGEQISDLDRQKREANENMFHRGTMLGALRSGCPLDAKALPSLASDNFACRRVRLFQAYAPLFASISRS